MSKTDVSRFFRCPYAWYLIDRREVAFEDSISQHQARLIADGQLFHTTAETELEARHVQPEQLRSARETLAADPAELWVPAGIVENKGRKLYGIPDAVVPSDGALYPIEIKSHAKPTRLDRLELAFYWLLLDEARPDAEVQPMGLLYLRTVYGLKEIEVELNDASFRELDLYIERIRDGRVNGIRPRICDCPLCSGPRRDEVLAAARASRDITLINGIGRMRAAWLEDLGIMTWSDLLEASPRQVRACLHAHKDYVTETEIERWREHARSYELDLPVNFGEKLDLGPVFLAIDLEYTSIGGLIYLIGVVVVDGDHCEHTTLWAKTAEEQTLALQQLADLAADHPGAPIVTWSGDSADMPALTAASRASGLDGILDGIFNRHVDLYQHARGSTRWPIPELTLKGVSEFLGLQRKSSIVNGFEALNLFSKMVCATDPKNASQLQDRLTEYLRDDLDNLVSVARELADCSGVPTRPAPEATKLPISLNQPGRMEPGLSGLLTRIDARISALRDEESRLNAALRALRSGRPNR